MNTLSDMFDSSRALQHVIDTFAGSSLHKSFSLSDAVILIIVLPDLRLDRSCHQMFSAVLFSQSTVSSSRAAKPSVPFGGWYREGS